MRLLSYTLTWILPYSAYDGDWSNNVEGTMMQALLKSYVNVNIMTQQLSTAEVVPLVKFILAELRYLHNSCS